MSSKNSLVTTKGTKFKEVINYMETRSYLVKEAITPSIAKNNIDTVNITKKPQSSKRKK